MAGPAHATHPHSVGFNLGVIALLVALLGIGFAYALDAAVRASRGGGAEAQQRVTRTLSGRELIIPQAWFRYEVEPVDGFVKQVDLRLKLPLGAKGRLATIEVTLLPRSRVRPSSSLLDGVYLHQFLPEQLSGPPGLVGKPLKAEDGFAGETVWYDALSPDPFVAKCGKETAVAQSAQCLRTVYLGPGMAAIYGFDESVLANWRQFDAALAPSLKSIGAL